VHLQNLLSLCKPTPCHLPVKTEGGTLVCPKSVGQAPLTWDVQFFFRRVGCGPVVVPLSGPFPFGLLWHLCRDAPLFRARYRGLFLSG